MQPLQRLATPTARPLIAVGVMMLGSAAKIDFDDLTEGVPAFVTLVMIVFTYNIANGMTAGLILYPVLKLLAGRVRELHVGLCRAWSGMPCLLRLWIAALRQASRPTKGMHRVF